MELTINDLSKEYGRKKDVYKRQAEFREEWNLPDKKPVKKKNRGMER